MQLEQAHTQRNSIGYYVRLGRDFFWLLLGALILAVLIYLSRDADLPTALATPVAVLRLLFGLFYALFAPGYCLTAAFFPREGDLDGIERFGLSLGLSVAWISILALILDWLPWGLRLWPIFLGELMSMLLFMALAMMRRARQPASLVYAPQMDWRSRRYRSNVLQLDKRVLLLLTITLLIAGISAAWIFFVPADDEFVTEFYILGEEGLAEDYPREVIAGEELQVLIGTVNRERNPLRYRVEVWAVDPWRDRRELVKELESFDVDRGQTIEQAVTWHMPWSGDDQIVDFLLYEVDQPAEAPYRSLRLWLNVLAEKDESNAAGGFQIVPP